LKQNNDGVGAKDATNMTMTITIRQAMKDAREPPEGSWQTKVPLGCVLSMSIHSCPRVRDECLAASSLVVSLELRRKL